MAKQASWNTKSLSQAKAGSYVYGVINYRFFVLRSSHPSRVRYGFFCQKFQGNYHLFMG